MNRMRTKLAIAGIILSGAFGYLAFAGMQKGWVYFVSVEQYLAEPQQFRDQRVRLHGRVSAEGFDARKALLTAQFQLTSAAVGSNASLPVVYRGVLPDLFEVGRDVVIEGRRDPAGTFQADVLMTKCASKYESGSPHAKAGQSKAEQAGAEHAQAEKRP